MMEKTRHFLSAAILAVVAFAGGLALGPTNATPSDEKDDGKSTVTREASVQNTRLPHANLPNTIRDWQPEGRKALLIRGPGNQWYRAEFRSNCHALPFAEEIGFITGGADQLDRFSSIVVEGERCWFKSFVANDPPGKKAS